MPKRTDIKTIMIPGAGPIIIGQACEFDYSGAQACKALKEEGYRVVLVNSNPATIMTDPVMADATYIEPLNWKVLERIIAKEKPDAILPTMGGQTALNLAMDLNREGILEKYGVELENMDYVQIHPTSLYSEKPGRHFLISESARGEGAILLNSKGERFVNELLPRDKVSAAIHAERKVQSMYGFPLLPFLRRILKIISRISIKPVWKQVMISKKSLRPLCRHSITLWAASM